MIMWLKTVLFSIINVLKKNEPWETKCDFELQGQMSRSWFKCA